MICDNLLICMSKYLSFMIECINEIVELQIYLSVKPLSA